MKYIAILIITSFLIVSCNKTSSRDELPVSTGGYNNVLVVVDDALWFSSLGDSIRYHLAEPIQGYSPAESMFTLNQVSSQLFNVNVKSYRNIIVLIDSFKQNTFDIQKNKHAIPQNYFLIQGVNKDVLLDQFLNNVDSIIKAIKRTELQAMTRHIEAESMNEKSPLLVDFNLEMNIPLNYKLVSNGDYFLWYKKNIASGSSSILIYSVGVNRIEKTGRSQLDNIMEVKDSITGKYVHSIEEESAMFSNAGHLPFNQMVNINGKIALEIRGNWDMESSFMSGPYQTYVFKDKYSQQYIFVEGLVYNPSSGKRKMFLELQAIINSIKFNR